MKRNFLRLFVATLLGLSILYIGGTAFATSIPNTSPNPKTFLGPTARLGVTKPMGDAGAFSLAGELGLKNLRLGGTLAWQISHNQRIKTNLELLRQKITYSFFDGRENAWVNQGAIGANYQYLFENNLPFNTAFDLSAYYSHAPSRTLGTSTGSFVDSDGITQNFTNFKRIAGSNAAGLSPGLSIDVMDGTRAGLALNYDNVRYDTVYVDSKDAKGFGGTAFIRQALLDDVSLGLSAAVRQPFNNYQADIAWSNVPYHGIWLFKLFGAYTIGKNTLPTTYNVGIAADYLIDAEDTLASPPKSVSLPEYKDSYKDKPLFAPPVEWDVGNKEFLAWTSAPAIYLPQVLAVPDERVPLLPACTAPTVTGTIPNLEPGGGITITLTDFFAGSDLVFTVNLFGQDPSGVSLSGAELTFDNSVSYTAISVTATNACGSATSNTFNFTVD